MAADMQNGHGLFFLDPHGNGISQLIAANRGTRPHQQPVVLDPTDGTHSFGINLLACSDVSSRDARRDTYTKAYGSFARIWEDDFTARPWLQLFIQNTIYAFIENPGCTLAEVPLFFDPIREDFRRHIVANVRYNEAVASFWQSEFFRPPRNQQERFEAALTRVNTLLGHEDVIHILGQQRTTIDFSKILDEQRIVLFRLSAYLPIDIKRFIGTIILSELLHAVRKRSTANPPQFCIFVDEVQHFATSEDFSICCLLKPANMALRQPSLIRNAMANSQITNQLSALQMRRPTRYVFSSAARCRTACA